MSHVHRDLKQSLPVAVKGEGAYIIDSTGKRYLDASGGPAVSLPRPFASEGDRGDREAGSELAYGYTLFFTSPAMEKLADRPGRAGAGRSGQRLLRRRRRRGGRERDQARAPVPSGARRAGRRLFIARRRSYHGNTLSTLALGEDVTRRAPYEALLAKVEHIEPCYEYRDRRADETAEAYGIRIADELDAAILQARAGRTSPPSSPSRSPAPVSARRRRCRATSSACARSATATACC